MSIWMLSKTFLIALLSLNLALGTVCKAEEGAYLPKGSAAPYEGFIFSVDQSQEIRKTKIERDYYKLTNESLVKSLNLDKDIIAQVQGQTKMALDQNDVISRSLRDERSMTNWERIAWTGVGAAIVLIVFYGIKATTK